jgi:hypothetical protein
VGEDIGTVKVGFQPWMSSLGEPLFVKEKDTKIVNAIGESRAD